MHSSGRVVEIDARLVHNWYTEAPSASTLPFASTLTSMLAQEPGQRATPLRLASMLEQVGDAHSSELDYKLVKSWQNGAIIWALLREDVLGDALLGDALQSITNTMVRRALRYILDDPAAYGLSLSWRTFAERWLEGDRGYTACVQAICGFASDLAITAHGRPASQPTEDASQRLLSARLAALHITSAALHADVMRKTSAYAAHLNLKDAACCLEKPPSADNSNTAERQAATIREYGTLIHDMLKAIHADQPLSTEGSHERPQ